MVCPSNNWQWVGMISGVSKPVPALSVTDAQREVLESLARSQSGLIGKWCGPRRC